MTSNPSVADPPGRLGRLLRERVRETADVEALIDQARRARRKDAAEARRLSSAALLAARVRRHGPLRADAARVLGQVELLLGRPRAALRHLREAERSGTADLAARLAPEIASTLALLGRTDESFAALDRAERALPARGAAERRAFLDLARGNVLHRLDRNVEAREALLRARRLFSRRKARVAVAGVDMNHANVLGNLHRYEEADALYRRAAAAYRAHGLEPSAMRADYNRAYLTFLRGRWHEALGALHDLRARFAALGDEYHVALCDLDEAEIHLALNLFAQADVLAARAADVFERLGLSLDRARALFVEAVAIRGRSRFVEAARILERAMGAFEKEGAEGWRAICLHRLAEIDRETGLPANARKKALDAAARLHDLGLLERAGRAEVLVASLDLDNGQPQRSVGRLEALLERVRGLSASHLLCEIHHVLGRAHAVLGRPRSAVKHLLRATRILERHRIGVPPDEFMASYLRDKASVYEDAVFFLLWLGGRRSRERAFEIAEQSKARALLDLLRTRTPGASGGARSLGRTADALGREIDGLVGRPPGELGIRSGTVPALRAAGEREARLAACLDRLEAEDPTAARLRRLRTPRWGEVRAALPDDTTLVEYVLCHDEVLAFCLTREAIALERIPLDRAALTATLAALRGEVDVRSPSSAAAADRTLADLHALLVAPVRRRLRTTRVVFVPHAALHAVPFHALLAHGRPLAETHEVVVAPSAAVYLHCLGRPAASRGTALLLGVPDAAAPLIEDEIRVLAGRLAGARAFLGPAATREVLVRESRRARLVHLAAHAEHHESDPMLSALRLGDGWLTVADLHGLRLAPCTVVLSGCATGRVCVTEGDDPFGLARGFLHAGAATIVHALWPVSDAVAATFMTRFHETLAATGSPAAALRRTALAVRARHPHPRDWAAFAVLGNGGPLGPR